MRIYLSGPMSDLPDHNFPAFHAYAAILREEGNEVVNPAEINDDTSLSWKQCLRADIRELAGCDAIALMPGWEVSDGAQLELHVAHRLGLQVMHVGTSFDLVGHLYRQIKFSHRTFGPGARLAGVCDHIRKELDELEDSGGALSEWIDVIILAFDGAWRSGATPQAVIDALRAKQAVNEGRRWPDWRNPDPAKAIEHVREAS